MCPKVNPPPIPLWGFLALAITDKVKQEGHSLGLDVDGLIGSVGHCCHVSDGEVSDGEGEVPDGEGEVPDGEGEVPDGEAEVPDGEGEVPGNERGETDEFRGIIPCPHGTIRSWTPTAVSVIVYVLM
eukprot:GHVO01067128.1.p1 GENE.GHVO01067128.1~~GHVO01067128.1.p1  ORF type:complete len:136 (+),score=22.68 GHVO01067128.1:30-410(+)